MRKKPIVVGSIVVVVVLVGLGLAAFQPWKLWIDDTVNEAAPAGAVPATVTTVTPDVTTPTSTSPTSTTPTSVPPAPAQFISIDKSTTGTIEILQDATGQQFLRFVDLETSNGPDLKVYLSTNAPDGEEGAFDDEFVNLGALKGNIGSQNYEIPAGTDLTAYTSVVIWCDRFDSAFGAAPLA